jgi:hypothetical protein
MAAAQLYLLHWTEGYYDSIPWTLVGKKEKKNINTGQLYYIWYKVINNVLNISTNL